MAETPNEPNSSEQKPKETMVTEKLSLEEMNQSQQGDVGETVVTEKLTLDQINQAGKGDVGETMVTEQLSLAEIGGESVQQNGDADKTVMSDNRTPDETMETVILTANQDIVEGTSPPPKGSAPTQMELKPRQTDVNAKYEVLGSLGKGGFAWVYKVKNVPLERIEAMKILNAELSEDEEVLERFAKEARISAKFVHQNIITIYEVQKRGSWSEFQVEDKIKQRHREPFAYFTMSFVEGNDANDLIKKEGRLAQRKAVKIIMDACAALEYAHSQNVVHRDIKPDNIFIDRKGKGIVMDFGIAKATDQTRKTAAGTFMGTARYVSPEQAMGKDIDGRSDLYSLGITLYELVTGNVPFDSDQWMTVLYQHINEPPPAPEKFYEDIDRDLRAVILKMLAKKPEDRFQTAGEVLDALRVIYAKLGGTDRSTESMDNIATRKDMAPGHATSATDVVSKPGAAKAPPVRTGQSAAAKPEEKSKTPMIIGAVIAAALLIGILVVVMQPKPAVEPTPANNTNNTASVDGPVDVTPKPPPPPLEEGRLLVSAYPKGTLVKLTNEAGESVAIDNPELPQILNLPEGSYQMVIMYDGLTRQIDGHVIASVDLSRANVSFDTEPEKFLLEDLQ